MDVGQHVIAFDKFGLAIDKAHKHPTDDGAYWRPAVIVTVNHAKETATIEWKDGSKTYNKPLSEMRQA